MLPTDGYETSTGRKIRKNIILSKGKSIALESEEFDLSSIAIGCDWDARPSLASRLFGGEESIDLDIVAFALCGGRLVEKGDE